MGAVPEVIDLTCDTTDDDDDDDMDDVSQMPWDDDDYEENGNIQYIVIDD
jgi:hypothetical protein